MARRSPPWMLEHSRHEAERKEREKAERKARGNRLYAVLAWRPDARYSGKDVWRWFKRKADADKWALGFNQGQGVAVRDYTALHDANAEWIPERAARLVADFVGKSSGSAQRHATKRKSPAQMDREIRHVLSRSAHAKLKGPAENTTASLVEYLVANGIERGGRGAALGAMHVGPKNTVFVSERTDPLGNVEITFKHQSSSGTSYQRFTSRERALADLRRQVELAQRLSGSRSHAKKKPPSWKQLAADYKRRARSAEREGGKVVRYPHGDLLILPVKGADEYYYSDWQADELLEKTKREYADLLKHISIEDLLLAQSQEW